MKDIKQGLGFGGAGDLGMGSKDQIPFDIFERVGICDDAPSNLL